VLFDLKGKRRRVVQATYLTLAVLMGGGLVLFGIGGDVSGGLFDAFSDRGQTGNGNEIVQRRVERNEKRLEVNPRSEAARKELVRDYYQLASAQTTDNQSGTFPKEAQDELDKADENWRAYLRLEPEKPDAGLATVALQLYDPTVLNKPKLAAEAAQTLARARGDSRSYLNLVQYAVLAKDSRTADLAAKKAVDLAPKKERKLVKQQAAQLKKAKG